MVWWRGMVRGMSPTHDSDDPRPAPQFPGDAEQHPPELRRYRCHKEVDAGKVLAIEPAPSFPEGSRVLVLDDGSVDHYRQVVDRHYMAKHEPQVGGYFVRYDDGYESWSPPRAFESGYTEIT